MFNLGLQEILLIATAALLVFGPKRLPELAKSLGKGIRDFKKALEGGPEEETPSLPSTPSQKIDDKSVARNSNPDFSETNTPIKT